MSATPPTAPRCSRSRAGGPAEPHLIRVPPYARRRVRLPAHVRPRYRRADRPGGRHRPRRAPVAAARHAAAPAGSTAVPRTRRRDRRLVRGPGRHHRRRPADRRDGGARDHPRRRRSALRVRRLSHSPRPGARARRGGDAAVVRGDRRPRARADEPALVGGADHRGRAGADRSGRGVLGTGRSVAPHRPHRPGAGGRGRTQRPDRDRARRRPGRGRREGRDGLGRATSP